MNYDEQKATLQKAAATQQLGVLYTLWIKEQPPKLQILQEWVDEFLASYKHFIRWDEVPQESKEALEEAVKDFKPMIFGGGVV